MNVLFIWPEYPDTFWGFRHALKFISLKAAQPPLGLLTVASFVPSAWNKRLVDMNVNPLTDDDLEWADMAFISAMTIQRNSVLAVLARCGKAGVTTVAGGPLFTSDPDTFDCADHLVLNEAELTLPAFLADLMKGEPAGIYGTDSFADLNNTPLPLWELIDVNDYALMNIQYSRGCPYECEFCEISSLYGRRTRFKSASQLVRELDRLKRTGWRGPVFFVDDNFIANRKLLKDEVLPALTGWMDANGRPFSFQTEVSVNIADDEDLMRSMVGAGFNSVFVGIETTNEDSLIECNKIQNRRRDLLESVETIQSMGMQVSAGFILGFDSDTPSVFDRMAGFIQNSGIVSAMVGLLNAPRNTQLYNRLFREGRIISDPTGDNTDFSLNFVPQMDKTTLVDGYRKVIRLIYSAGPYYERVRKYLLKFKPGPAARYHVRPMHIKAFFRSIYELGIRGDSRRQFWKLLLWTLFRKPKLFPLAVTYAIYGFHFRRYFEACLSG